MIGIFVILACWGVGNLLSMLTGGYVSGNVIGMVLLYAMLHYRVVKAEQVAPVALFFVPFGVGLMTSYEVIAENWVAVVAAAAISTVLVIAVIGVVCQKMRKR